jgi:hypothetical protein
MLIADALKEIYKRFEKSIDEPDNDSEDYIVRLSYANKAIRQWENELGMNWKELYGTLSGTLVNGVCNDQTTLATFKSPEGYLRIGSDRYTYVRPERVERETTLYPSKKVYTVTGSKGSKSINVYPAISADFYLDYKKYATTYVTGEETTEIEMSNPEFLISFVIAMLYLDDDNSAQAGVEMQSATGAMESMKLDNEKIPFFQEQVEDDNFQGFGN